MTWIEILLLASWSCSPGVIPPKFFLGSHYPDNKSHVVVAQAFEWPGNEPPQGQQEGICIEALQQVKAETPLISLVIWCTGSRMSGRVVSASRQSACHSLPQRKVVLSLRHIQAIRLSFGISRPTLRAFSSPRSNLSATT